MAMALPKKEEEEGDEIEIGLGGGGDFGTTLWFGSYGRRHNPKFEAAPHIFATVDFPSYLLLFNRHLNLNFTIGTDFEGFDLTFRWGLEYHFGRRVRLVPYIAPWAAARFGEEKGFGFGLKAGAELEVLLAARKRNGKSIAEWSVSVEAGQNYAGSVSEELRFGSGPFAGISSALKFGVLPRGNRAD